MTKWKTIVFRILIGLFIFILIATISMTFVVNYFKSTIKIPPSITNVSVIEVTNSNYTGTINLAGFVKTNTSGNLYILASGKVDNILVKPGQEVKKGQVILTLDTKAEQSNLAAQKANLNALRLNYEGLQAVYKQGGASRVSLEQARASYNQLLSTVEATEQALDNKKIIAPYDGTLGAINVSIGNVVQPGQQLATVIPSIGRNFSSYVNLEISPSLLPKLSIGNKAAAYNDKGEFLENGKVSALDSSISATTGSSQIRVNFNDNNKLQDGKFLKVKVSTNELKNQIVIPDIAVNYTLYGQTVYKVVPLTKTDKASLEAITSKAKSEADKDKILQNIYKVQEVFIKSHNRVNDLALVEAGLKPGDIIITNGIQIKDGKFVRIIPGYGIGVPHTFMLPPQAITSNTHQQSKKSAITSLTTNDVN